LGRFFPEANIEDIIKNFKNSNNNSYNEHFTYPKNGAIEYISALFTGVKKENILINTSIIKIDKTKKIAYTNKGEIKYDRIISSMPFPNLLDICELDYNKSIYNWNKVLVFNLGFDKKGTDLKNHWIYFPEKDYCFYRVGYYDNILLQNKMSLYVELGFKKEAEIDIDKYFKLVLDDLKKAKIILDHKLTDYHFIVMDPAYVQINSKSVKDVLRLKSVLESFDIFSIGRYGSWKYCSIEDDIIEARSLFKKAK
jgi:protoporphyrinogen oxidase